MKADPTTTLREYFETEFLPKCPLSSRPVCVGVVKHFLAFSKPDITLAEVTPELIKQFTSHLVNRSMALVTVYNYVRCIRRIVGLKSEYNPAPQPSQETIEQAARLAAEGKRPRDIAELFSVHESTISRWKRANPDTWEAAVAARREEVGELVDAAIFDERIAKAAAMAALGKPRKEVATTLGYSEHAVRDWQNHHPDAWRHHFDRAMESVLATVRAQVGTDAILEDPDGYLQRAGACQKWANAKGVKLFEASDGLTLTTFFETYYRPNCMDPATAADYWFYPLALRRWTLFMGDPLLEKITTGLLAKFRDCLMKLTNRSRTKLVTARSVMLYMSAVQTLLDKAGPPSYRNRDAAGILDKVPWVRPPRTIRPPVRTVPSELLSTAYLATADMETPRVEGIKPPAWWRSLLAIAYNTGLRRGTLFKLRMDHIDWKGCQLIIPGEIIKTKRLLIVPLNEMCLAHLREIRTDRELVFPFPFNQTAFDKYFHRLQASAGIPRDKHFGLQDIRRTTATVLWETSPAAAQLTLGHTTSSVTRQHYVAGGGIIARAMNAMPQPAAFSATGLSPAKGGAA